MTIREWLSTRTPAAPAPLRDRLDAILGERADASAAAATQVFIEAARETLDELLAARRFERDGALDLLAVDALMTFAYEHAAESGLASAVLEQLTRDGVARLAPLARAHG